MPTNGGRFKLRVRRLGFVAVAIAFWNGAMPSAVSASCDPGRDPVGFAGFAGTQMTPFTKPDGAKADILEYAPFAEEGSEVSAWTMLQVGGTRWAQVGWYRSKDGGAYTRSVFTQYTNDSGQWLTNFWAAQPLGTRTTYQTDYVTGPARVRMLRGGNLLISAAVSWVPDNFQMYGETHQKGDQMAGGTLGHEVFENTYYSVTNSSSWSSLTSSVGVNVPAWYGATKVNTIRFEIWDKSCEF